MNPSHDSVVIVAAQRTPIGAFQGALSSLTAPQLGAAALKAAVSDSGIAASAVDAVLMGCVLTAGIGQAPARQAALAAGLPLSTPCTTINKVCGSGMSAVLLGHDLIRAGSANIVAAGGMESMSNTPYLLPKARNGYRLGHGELLDHMFFDGLQDAREGHLMGHYAENAAQTYGFSRTEQDAYVLETVRRAQAALHDGAFLDEVVPVTVTTRAGSEVVAEDETPGKCNPDKIPQLKPAFRKDGSGTVTAANSSSISDGAAAVVLMRADAAEQQGLAPLARIIGHASYAHEPGLFTSAPVGAIRALLKRTGWSLDSVDLFEVNEAFAVVAMIALRELDLSHDRMNVHGGACALGHPIGASGTRILVTLLHALRRRGLRRGIASLCIGGGEATALAVEVV